MTRWLEKTRIEDKFETPQETERLLSATPYVHWWATRERTARSHQHADVSADGAELWSPANLRPLSIAQRLAPGKTVNAGFGVNPGAGPVDVLALPGYAVNPGFDPTAWLPDDLDRRMGDVPRDTVIVGIIDDAIALGHARFRLPMEDGRLDTRILACWHQGGTYDNGPQPFGREVFRDGIAALMNRHGSGNWLDEEAFNRAIDPPPAGGGGLSNGARGLAGAGGHGTHVLDLACGHDPDPANKSELARQRIIAVNLPSRTSVGMAGTFLEFYVVYAMRRIVEMADRLWTELGHGKGGFPVVLNLSYGQQAGTKTGTSLIEQEFRRLELTRPAGAELRLVMPVGNDNLTRSNARWRLRRKTKGKDSGLPVSWRILPQDQSSNFVEVWIDLKDGEASGDKDPFPLQISVTEPGRTDRDWLTGKDGTYFDHPGGFLRIYASRRPVADMSAAGVLARHEALINGTTAPATALWRQRFVIAMRPTLDHERPGESGLAGRWTIALRWASTADFSDEDDRKHGREVYVNTQVDQDPSPVSSINHRSYFDGERYHTHAPSGRVLDTFAYLVSEYDLAGSAANLEPSNKFWSIQRKGTHNALANDEQILLIAGHRASDGRPADFSATTYPDSRRPTTAFKTSIADTPAASFPVDINPTRTGIRAAGTTSGSSIVLRGTSSAAPQATRWALAEFRDALKAGQSDLSALATPLHLRRVAAKFDKTERASGGYAAKTVGLKTGSGRMPVLDVRS